MYTAELAAVLMIQYEQNVLGLTTGEYQQPVETTVDL